GARRRGHDLAAGESATYIGRVRGAAVDPEGLGAEPRRARRRRAARRGQESPRRLDGDDLRREVLGRVAVSVDDVDGDDQVGADEAAGVEGPGAVRVRELLDGLLRALHRSPEVRERADLDAVAVLQADDDLED